MDGARKRVFGDAPTVWDAAEIHLRCCWDAPNSSGTMPCASRGAQRKPLSGQNKPTLNEHHRQGTSPWSENPSERTAEGAILFCVVQRSVSCDGSLTLQPTCSLDLRGAGAPNYDWEPLISLNMPASASRLSLSLSSDPLFGPIFANFSRVWVNSVGVATVFG